MSNSGASNGEIVAEASERVLKQIAELYEKGLGGATPGSLGLKAIADHPLVNLSKQIRKPRKKIRCDNHLMRQLYPYVASKLIIATYAAVS
jgi:hypothetical protein